MAPLPCEKEGPPGNGVPLVLIGAEKAASEALRDLREAGARHAVS